MIVKKRKILVLVIIVALVFSGVMNMNTQKKLNEYVEYDLTETYDSMHISINNAESILDGIVMNKKITLDNLDKIIYINSILNIEIEKVLRAKYSIYYGNTKDLPRLFTDDVDKVYNSIMKDIIKSENKVYNLNESDLSDFNTVLAVYRDLKGIIESGTKNTYINRLNEIYSIHFFNYY